MTGKTDQVAVNVASQEALLDDLEQQLRDGTGFSIATLNLDHVVKLRRDPAFRKAYLAHSHVTADGNPIVWMSALAGQPVSLVTGADLIEPLIDRAARTGAKVAFFGATETSLTRAAEALLARWPTLDIVFSQSPAMGFDPESANSDAAIQALEASGARLCFIALGAPKQEQFAARAQQVCRGTGFVSIGAGLDFIAGEQTRAPEWMRRGKIEWIWRLLENPRRLAGRYASCALVMPSLAIRALRARSGGDMRWH